MPRIASGLYADHSRRSPLPKRGSVWKGRCGLSAASALRGRWMVVDAWRVKRNTPNPPLGFASVRIVFLGRLPIKKMVHGIFDISLVSFNGSMKVVR